MNRCCGALCVAAVQRAALHRGGPTPAAHRSVQVNAHDRLSLIATGSVDRIGKLGWIAEEHLMTAVAFDQAKQAKPFG